MASNSDGQTMPDDITPISRRALLNSGAAVALAGTAGVAVAVSSATAQSSGVQHSVEFLRAKNLWDQYWHEWGKLGDLLGAEYDAEKARVEPILEPLFDEYKMIRDGLIAQSNVSFTRLYDLAAMQRWEFWDEDGKHSEDFEADIENAMLTLVEALARGGADA